MRRAGFLRLAGADGALAASGVPMNRPAPAPDVPGIQSLEIGLGLFDLLVRQGSPCGLSDLARQAGMHRAKAYRYLVSLVRAGWVLRDEQGDYAVGPAMRELAVVWLGRQDPIQLAGTEARALAQSIGQTCFVAIPGQAGATVARVYQPDRVVSISIAEGAVLNAKSSASGRAFAAWQDDGGSGLSRAVRQRIRTLGLAVVEGEHVSGVNALSAPVFDAQGRVAAVLTLVGPAATLPADAGGAAADGLRAAARRVSAALGGNPPVAGGLPAPISRSASSDRG